MRLGFPNPLLFHKLEENDRTSGFSNQICYGAFFPVPQIVQSCKFSVGDTRLLRGVFRLISSV